MARFASPLEAEAAFYAAFSRRDLEAMMAVWDDAADIVCVHPMGAMLVGRDAIRESWEAIFRHGPPLTFVVQEQMRTHGETVAVHVVHEHARAAPEPAPPPLTATNAYRLTANGWRMILHHTSPPPRSGSGEQPAAPTLH
jgi:uncharacterized protein (TIGR02246 family)